MTRMIALVARREVQDAVRNRWFQAYTIGFAALSAGVGLLVLFSASYGDPAGFGRAAAGMVNLVLLLAPLMGLTLGAQSLAGERERGTLAYLLAQPVTVAEVFAGKVIGLGLALGGAILAGFAASTLIIGLGGEGRGAGAFAVLAGLTVLLAWISLGLGCLISSRARRTSAALGVAVVVWLALAFLGDLGLIGTTIALELPPEVLLGAALINPLESYRIAAISTLEGTLDLLGPAGLAARHLLGPMVFPLLLLILLVWLIGTLFIAGIRTIHEEMR